MATNVQLLDLSFPAEEDLRNDQFRIVVLDSTSGKVRRPNSSDEPPIGVLQNTPNINDAATVRVLGVSQVVAGAAISRNDYVRLEYVGATDAGKALPCSDALDRALGLALGIAGAEDDLVSVLICYPGGMRVNIAS